jgi:TRAP-type mannitol/chloroaromatic compound transport system permease large subunit
MALAAKMQLPFAPQLNGSFEWLTSNAALTALGIATFAEIVADKVPTVDHVLDSIGTIARPAAGTLAAASVFHGSDPAFASMLGLIIGAPTAFGFHAAKAGTRATSSVGTFGLLNPVLSFFEDMAAIVMIFVALLVPVLVPLFLIAFGFVLWKMVKLVRRKNWRTT